MSEKKEIRVGRGKGKMGACRHVFTTVQCIHDPSLYPLNATDKEFLKIIHDKANKMREKQGEIEWQRIEYGSKMMIAYDNVKKSKSLLVYYLSNI